MNEDAREMVKLQPGQLVVPPEQLRRFRCEIRIRQLSGAIQSLVEGKTSEEIARLIFHLDEIGKEPTGGEAE